MQKCWWASFNGRPWSSATHAQERDSAPALRGQRPRSITWLGVPVLWPLARVWVGLRPWSQVQLEVKFSPSPELLLQEVWVGLGSLRRGFVSP